MQAQAVPSELVMKHFGSLNSVTFSPIVSIEPRRRKFHCPIRLKVPLPAGYRSDLSANLHLLCSITGGQNRAVWEDVTGSTPLSLEEGCLVFTTTVSARFWLVHCRQASQCPESTRYAQEIYRQLIAVPFMAKFVVFAKRRDINEANVRVFCMTDDKEERTLEVQEHYTQVARSRDVEVLEGQKLYLEFGGNLLPTHLSGLRGRPARSSALLNEQLFFAFRAFQENRLAFAVRLKEIGQEASGRLAFMEDSLKYLASLNAQQRAYLAERRRRAICTLGLQLPAMCVNHDNILGTPKRNSYYASARIGDLSLADIAQELEEGDQSQSELITRNNDSGASLVSSSRTAPPLHHLLDDDSLHGGATTSGQQADWMELAPRLGIPRDEVEFIANYCESNQQVSPALILLMHWFKLASPDTRDQDLARALINIGRPDVARKLNFPVEPKRISRSTMELLREIELIPVRSSEDLYASSELSARSRGASLRRLDHLQQQQQRQQLRQQPLPLSGRASAEPEGIPVSSREWLHDDGSQVNVRVEQTTTTTYLEPKPRSSGKKQRRRLGEKNDQQQQQQKEDRKGAEVHVEFDLGASEISEAFRSDQLEENLAPKVQTGAHAQPPDAQRPLESSPGYAAFITSEAPALPMARQASCGKLAAHIGAGNERQPQRSHPDPNSGGSCDNRTLTQQDNSSADSGDFSGATTIMAPQLESLLNVNARETAQQLAACQQLQERGSKGMELRSVGGEEGVVPMCVDLDLPARKAGEGCGLFESGAEECTKFKDTEAVASSSTTTITLSLHCNNHHHHEEASLDQKSTSQGQSIEREAQKQQRPSALSGDLEQQEQTARVVSLTALACQTSTVATHTDSCAHLAHFEHPQQRAQLEQVHVDNSGALQSRVARPNTTTGSSSDSQDRYHLNQALADKTVESSSSGVGGGGGAAAAKSPEDLVHRLALESSQRRTCLLDSLSGSNSDGKKKKRHSLPEELRWRIFPHQTTDPNKSPKNSPTSTSAKLPGASSPTRGEPTSSHLDNEEEDTQDTCKTPTTNTSDQQHSTPTLNRLSSSSANRPDNLSSSTTTYRTAPNCLSSTSNPDEQFITPPASRSSTSVYESARSELSGSPVTLTSEQRHHLRRNTDASSSSTLAGACDTDVSNASEMVSFFVAADERSARHSTSRLSHSSADTGTPTITPNTEELEDMSAVVDQEMAVDEFPDEPIVGKQQAKSQSPTPCGSSQCCSAPNTGKIPIDSSDLADELDDEQLKRLLTYKRLSEGCCSRAGLNFARKNSLHMMVEELPPLTEGEPMKHMSLHLSQNIESAASSGSSGSLRTTSCISRQNLMRELALKRGSQDENTSCSSSTSLERSPTRRRSSTVSQCSSVLSEGTRNQLNFDLSPDLAPDSSLLEANAISPTDFDRPCSPEPSSLSGDAFDLRPGSCVSPLDELMSVTSPDSTLGDSNDVDLAAALADDARFLERAAALIQPVISSAINNNSNKQLADGSARSNQVAQHTSETPVASSSDEVEQLISDVSTVLVSGGNKSNAKRPAMDDSTGSERPSSGLGKKPAKSSNSQDGTTSKSLSSTCTMDAQSVSQIHRSGSLASQQLPPARPSEDGPAHLRKQQSAHIHESSTTSTSTSNITSQQDAPSAKFRLDGCAGNKPTFS